MGDAAESARPILAHVTDTGVPVVVRQFLASEIESVTQLEVLLLARAAPDKDWTALDVGRALTIDQTLAESWLVDLAARGLVAERGAAYHFAPPSLEVELAIDALAESYARYRVTVIGLIFSKPSEQVQSLADAFRLRRRD